jgi:hypothetical protein
VPLRQTITAFSSSIALAKSETSWGPGRLRKGGFLYIKRVKKIFF